MMSLHILGICGTFMGSVALLAKEMGLEVTGSDSGAYPPISTQLEKAGIAFHQQYDIKHLHKNQQIIVGNVMRRGWPIVEHLLNERLSFISGAHWVAQNILKDRHVLAVSGTHGKTSTASMLAWILYEAGLSPGFLIGGVPKNFGVSARLGEGPYFVIEADEYDTAFFDKRSKFIHYWPETLIINNLEFDHADIFVNLADIQKQFHHLVRTLPGKGLIVYPKGSENIDEVLSQGCWTPTALTQVVKEHTAIDQEWAACAVSPDGHCFDVWHHKEKVGQVKWSLIGQHHVHNGLAALAAAYHVGVQPKEAIAALNQFKGVARRLEICGQAAGVTLYDDFAHHPTAIASVLSSLRARLGPQKRIIAAIEFNSYTMRMGYHSIPVLGRSLKEADIIHCLKPKGADWDVSLLSSVVNGKIDFFDDTATLIKSIVKIAQAGDHVITMSNGHFGGIQGQLLLELKKKEKNNETCKLI